MISYISYELQCKTRFNTVRQGQRLVRYKGKQDRAQDGSLGRTSMTVSDSRGSIADANTLSSTVLLDKYEVSHASGEPVMPNLVHNLFRRML